MPEPLDPLVKAERAIQRLVLDNTRLRALNKKLSNRGAGYEDLVEGIRQHLEKDTAFSYKAAKATIAKPHDPTHAEIAAVAVSDLHLSEVVKKTDSNGINEYNSIIAANRLWYHAQKVKSILSRHQAIYNIDKIWSPLLGDMINGSIHPEMIVTNDMSDASSVILCARLLEMFYKELSSLGLPIDIDTIVGNHPRTTVKMPTKRQAHSNLDWVVYEMLHDKLTRDDQFTMTVHTSQIGMKKLYKHNYVFEHGIGVKSGDEAGFEDRIRAMFDDPVYRKATGYQGSSFDQIVIGNMHQPKFLERTIVNGCYTGQNELGMSWRLKPIKAMQAMWGISAKQVRTWQYGIDLTDVKSNKADNVMSEYATWFIKRHGR